MHSNIPNIDIEQQIKTCPQSSYYNFTDIIASTSGPKPEEREANNVKNLR